MIKILQKCGAYIYYKSTTESIHFDAFLIFLFKVPLLETHVRIKRLNNNILLVNALILRIEEIHHEFIKHISWHCVKYLVFKMFSLFPETYRNEHLTLRVPINLQTLYNEFLDDEICSFLNLRCFSFEL